MFVTLYYKKDTLHYKHINIGRKMGFMYIENLSVSSPIIVLSPASCIQIGFIVAKSVLVDCCFKCRDILTRHSMQIQSVLQRL